MNQIDKIKELVDKLNKYAFEYYTLDNPSISDKEYDKLYDELVKKYIIKIDSKRINDITGNTYEKLFIIGYIGKSADKRSLWLCRCSCKNKVLKICTGTEITKGNIKSCGCLIIDKNKDRIIDNGLRNANNRIYRIWRGMHDRCYNKNGKDYEHYGQRGIGICKEWISNFMNFYQWAYDNGYKEDLTIERINVNGKYEPSNCKWITREEQAKNKTNTIKVLYNNKEHVLKDLVREKGLVNDYKAIVARITKYNWSLEKALTTPVAHKSTYQ